MENSTPIVTTATYNAPVEKVWQAITDREEMRQWYFDMPDFEPRVGCTFSFYEPGGANKFLHRCTISEVVPHKRLRHTWTHPELSKGSSVVTWELEPVGDKTRVTLTHEGVESFADGGADFARANYVEGWRQLLGESLKKFLER